MFPLWRNAFAGLGGDARCARGRDLDLNTADTFTDLAKLGTGDAPDQHVLLQNLTLRAPRARRVTCIPHSVAEKTLLCLGLVRTCRTSW